MHSALIYTRWAFYAIFNLLGGFIRFCSPLYACPTSYLQNSNSPCQPVKGKLTSTEIMQSIWDIPLFRYTLCSECHMHSPSHLPFSITLCWKFCRILLGSWKREGSHLRRLIVPKLNIQPNEQYEQIFKLLPWTRKMGVHLTIHHRISSFSDTPNYKMSSNLTHMSCVQSLQRASSSKVLTQFLQISRRHRSHVTRGLIKIMNWLRQMAQVWVVPGNARGAWLSSRSSPFRIFLQ